MFDVDWFLSILDKPDMAYLCQKFKLNVTGFQRNMNNAPKKSLGNTIKTALNNGFQKKRGNKHDHLPFEDMLTEIAKDQLAKYPFLSGLSFHKFAIRAELEPDLKIYEIVSVTYYQFPNEYEEHLQTIVTNIKSSRYIFYGLSEELSKTSIEKIFKIVGADIITERNYKLLKQFEEECLNVPNKKIYTQLKEIIQDEDTAFRALASSDKEMHIFILVAFLLANERYRDENYKNLVNSAAIDIQALEIERLNLTLKEKEKELIKIESKLQNMTDEKRMIEDKNSQLVDTLNIHTDKEKDRIEKIELLTKKLKTLEDILQKNEPLQLVYFRIISDNNFVIVTKDVGEFVGTPFESVTILPSQFKKEIKTNAVHAFKEQTVFVTRSSFSNGTEWYKFKQFLEKHQLQYEELGQYDITCYIQEIIQFLSRKEVLVYADEI